MRGCIPANLLYGGFHKYTTKWMVYITENPTYINEWFGGNPPFRRLPYNYNFINWMNMMKHWISVCRFMENVKPKRWMEIDHTADSWLILGVVFYWFYWLIDLRVAPGAAKSGHDSMMAIPAVWRPAPFLTMMSSCWLMLRTRTQSTSWESRQWARVVWVVWVVWVLGALLVAVLVPLLFG